ncbi:MAG: DUF3858 domain-containing protein, partial [Bacteroidales bacterium]|nr:DUF3858 domain-containing protein [Bacteroidales bacterium]
VLDYTIHTAQPFIPELMERVDLYENAPIDRYEISVNLPKDKSLNYYLNYRGENLTQTQSCNADSTVQSMQWVYTNLDQNPNVEYMVRDYLPYMLLTTVGGPDVFMGQFVIQNAFSNLNTDMYRSVLNEICPDTLTEMQKIVAIRDYVADNIYTNQVPMKMMNYIVASPAYVWSTNCGNAFEKDLLLFSMLRSMGFSANVGLMFNDLMSDPKSLVNVSVNGRNYFITAAEKTNLSMENKYALDSYIPVTGEVTPFDAYPTHIYVDASVQVERVSGKMRPEVKVNRDTIITQKMNVLVPEDKQLAITEVETLNGNYYSVTIEDGPYGCDMRSEWLDQERHHPVFAPITDETYRYEITLPERTRWVGKNFLYEQTYDFGHIKIQYQYDGNKLVIVRELEIVMNFIDSKYYKKFRQMMADWCAPRMSVFAYERQ